MTPLAEATAVSSGMTFEEVRATLAHRFPFLMIDRVTIIERGVRLEALKHVTGNEICFLGHFPKRAVMPGVLIIECMAQALSLLDKASRDPGHPAAKYLGRVDAQFFRPVLPGDSLQVHVHLIKQVRFGVIGSAHVNVDNEKVARAEISLGMGEDGDV